MSIDDKDIVGLYHYNLGFTDSSGKGNDIIPNGTILDTINPKLGPACASFDGVNDDLVIPPSTDFDFIAPFAIIGWVRQDEAFPAASKPIVWKGNTTGAGLTTTFQISILTNNKVFIAISNGVIRQTLTSTLPLTVGLYTAVGLVITGTTLKLIINDSFDKTAVQTVTPQINTNRIIMGDLEASVFDNAFFGLLDEWVYINDDFGIEDVEEFWNDGLGKEVRVAAASGKRRRMLAT